MSSPTQEPLVQKRLPEDNAVDAVNQPPSASLQRLANITLGLVVVCAAAVLVIKAGSTIDSMTETVATVIPEPSSPEALIGGTVVLVALSFLGVPVAIAAAAAVSTWIIVQGLMN